MKHVWSIDRLLENVIVLKSGIGENLTAALYSETGKSFNLEKT